MPAKFTSSFLKVNTISPPPVPCLYSSEPLFSRSSAPPSEYLPPPRLFRAKFCSAFSHELPSALLRLRRALSKGKYDLAAVRALFVFERAVI